MAFSVYIDSERFVSSARSLAAAGLRPTVATSILRRNWGVLFISGKSIANAWGCKFEADVSYSMRRGGGGHWGYIVKGKEHQSLLPAILFRSISRHATSDRSVS